MTNRAGARRGKGSEPKSGDPLPPVPRAPRLDTIDRVRAELARVYRHCKAGGLSWEYGAKAAHILATIGRLLEGGELERRLAALEAQTADAGAIETKERW